MPGFQTVRGDPYGFRTIRAGEICKITLGYKDSSPPVGYHSIPCFRFGGDRLYQVDLLCHN